VLSSSRSDGSNVYINSPSSVATCAFIQHQVHSRRRPSASTTWIEHPVGAGSDMWFGGMARSESPSLLTILEESASMGDSTSSEGESNSSPLLRACITVIPVWAHTPTLSPKVTSASQAAAARPQRITTSTTLPEQLAAHQEGRRRADVLQRESALEASWVMDKETGEQQLPAFTTASQNIAAVAALLNALSITPANDGGKVR
jgi:hypothetical protein